MYGSGLAEKDMNSPDLRRKDDASGAILSENVTPNHRFLDPPGPLLHWGAAVTFPSRRSTPPKPSKTVKKDALYAEKHDLSV